MASKNLSSCPKKFTEMQSFRQKKRKNAARIFSSENVCCLYEKCYHLTMEIKLKSNHNFHFLRFPERCDSMRLLGRVAICKKFRFSSSRSTSYKVQDVHKGEMCTSLEHMCTIQCVLGILCTWNSAQPICSCVLIIRHMMFIIKATYIKDEIQKEMGPIHIFHICVCGEGL